MAKNSSVILSALCALTMVAPSFAQDSIVQLDGSILNGKIETASISEITWKDGRGKSQTTICADVLNLELTSLEGSLRAGEQYIANFDYQNASGAFSAIAESSDGLLGELAALRNAEVLLAWSQIDKSKATSAKDAFSSWLAANPESWFSPRAQTGQAMATSISGNSDEAAKLLEALASFAFEKNLSPHIEMAARVDRCEVFLMGNQANVAEARLQDLVPKIESEMRSGDSSASLRLAFRKLHSRGQILLGDAIEAKDGVAKARSYWENLSRDRDSSLDVRAAATVGAARAARQSGATRDAQLLLAKVVATMPASREVTARALFELAETCAELGNTPTSAKSYYQRLVDDYSSTSWAVKARLKLGS